MKEQWTNRSSMVCCIHFVVPAFHNNLDFISVHETIVSEMRSALEGVSIKQPLDAQIETIARKKASKLNDMPSLRNVSMLNFVHLDHVGICAIRSSRIWFDSC